MYLCLYIYIQLQVSASRPSIARQYRGPPVNIPSDAWGVLEPLVRSWRKSSLILVFRGNSWITPAPKGSVVEPEPEPEEP